MNDSIVTIAGASPPLAQTSTSHRIDSIDLLRGLAMVVMALDHVRHFFSDSLDLRPTDLSESGAALFLTRWITHFCAPTFVFLAGTSAFLSAARGKNRNDLALFLLTRGFWLIALELTFVRRFGWTFNFDFHYNMGAVLWALGWSMVCLAWLIYLPLPAIAAFGIVMIASHNLFDHVTLKSMGSLGWLWKILHRPGVIEFAPGFHFKIAYPLIPWIGVMAAGYAFGIVFTKQAAQRRKLLLSIGFTLVATFLVLRAFNLYGDRRVWRAQSDPFFTFLSFINCSKYPASLLFLLMTLGPLIITLALFDRSPRFLKPLMVFGRVPLFYYLLHLPLIHAVAVLCSYARYGEASWLFANPPLSRAQPLNYPADYGYALPVIYLVWLAVTLLLYPACVRFNRIKQRSRNPLLRYF